ncbi:MAG TPA: hypothetical protein VGH76_14815 [Actinomycetospora sp.]|jgi:hypothetical protein|uniref:hypothetical protein n=1 Tax=Actinomycetospora sp. TaxID=1872135 RepID=UPI002F3E894B
MLGSPTWPPPDTDRNRFLFRLGFPVGVLASAYVLTFALLSNGWLPYVVAVLLIAATLMLGIGLLLMRAQRRAAGPAAEPTKEPDEAPDGAEGAPTPRPRPRPAPNAR